MIWSFVVLLGGFDNRMKFEESVCPYPGPVKSFITVQAALIETDSCWRYDVFLNLLSTTGCAFLFASFTRFTSESSLGVSPDVSRRKLAIRSYGRNCTTLR